MIIWLVVMGSLFALQAVVEDKELSRLPGLWLIMLCFILALEILNQYFSYLVLYPDSSFRKVDWFYRRPRVHPKEIIAIGFVPRALDKVYQDLYFNFRRNGIGRTREFRLGIKAYGQHTLAELIDQIVRTNPQVQLDTYCQDLVNKYRAEPDKLEKNWQDKFKFKWLLPQWATDILMFLLLLLCIYLFLHIATLNGYCFGRDHCYPGPMI